MAGIFNVCQLLDVADKVSEQFSKLYPEFVDIDVINTICMFAHKFYSSYERKVTSFDKTKHNGYERKVTGPMYGSSRISGSGGRSYSGGGNSSRGSSGGGFR